MSLPATLPAAVTVISVAGIYWCGKGLAAVRNPSSTSLFKKGSFSGPQDAAATLRSGRILGCTLWLFGVRATAVACSSAATNAPLTPFTPFTPAASALATLFAAVVSAALGNHHLATDFTAWMVLGVDVDVHLTGFHCLGIIGR